MLVYRTNLNEFQHAVGFLGGFCCDHVMICSGMKIEVVILAFCASSEALCSYSSIRALSTHTSENKKNRMKIICFISNTSCFIKIFVI